MEKPTAFERFNNWAKNSVTLRLITIAILILILLIPSSMIGSLVNERESRRDEAINEISSKWGRSQTIGGPVLTVPYHPKYRKDLVEYAHFLPEELDIAGNLNTEMRYCGIYEAVLYNSQLTLKGKFNFPQFQEWSIPNDDILWNEATLSLGITDLLGVKDTISLTWHDKQLTFEPGLDTKQIFKSGVSIGVPLNKDVGNYNYEIKLNVNGSQNMMFLPVGKTTTVNLDSPWTAPSFNGDFLPEKRDITEDGFTASWKLLNLNRNYPQSWLNETQKIQKPMFGVELLLPVDEYKKTDRAVKYSSLFIFLTFLAFFLIETINKKRIHPIQYLLVGFAITLFYLLLLSLSEYLRFSYAYLIGSIAILLMVAVYSKSILKKFSLSLLIGLVIALLYGFFYTLLQLQDYSLLLGSIGLFIILAIVMVVTRNINWYGFRAKKEE